MRLRLLFILASVLMGSLLVPDARAAGPITGLDVSRWQHSTGKAIDWAAVQRSGQRFAIIKATGYADRVDPWFAREWAAAGRAGIIRGAYHYAKPSASPSVAVSGDRQAALVVRTVGTTREARNLGIALDLEDHGGLSPNQLAAWAHAFLDGVERRTGRVPLLYSYVNFWKTRMANNRTFGAYPLWLARYSNKQPAPLAGWTQWTFWQHTSSFRVPGIVGPVDRNIMCCSAGTLAALADGRSLAITKLWRQLGGASGALGLPLGTEVAVAGGWAQTFQRGLIAHTKKYGAHPVLGKVYERYRAAGGARGTLGIPVARQRTHPLGILSQDFTGGTIVYTPAVGAHIVTGPILARWKADGGVRSQEGVPLADARGVGQQFVGGGLYRTKKGVRLVPGAIRDRYEELGGPSSPLGLPTSEARVIAGTRVVSFELGSLVEVVVGNQHIVI